MTLIHQMAPTQQNGCDSGVFAIMVSLLRKHLNISTPLAVHLTLSLTQRFPAFNLVRAIHSRWPRILLQHDKQFLLKRQSSIQQGMEHFNN